MKYMFNIGLSMGIHACGDTMFQYEVTDEEMEIINKCKNEGIEFEECEELQDLYERVYEAADEQLHDDWADNHDDELDDYSYDYWVSF